jgi:hypothetical protein
MDENKRLKSLLKELLLEKIWSFERKLLALTSRTTYYVDLLRKLLG